MDVAALSLAFGRMVPVQLLTHGHASTSGLQSVDAFVSYAPLEAPEAQANYAEQLIQLAHMSPYPPPDRMHSALMHGVRHWTDDVVAAGADPGNSQVCLDFWRGVGATSRHASSRVYYVSQTLFKLGPEFDLALLGVLEVDKRAVIVLKRYGVRCEGFSAGSLSCGSRMGGDVLHLRIARRLGPKARGRIFFLPAMNTSDYALAMLCASAVLDPYPFGGYTTIFEALRIGVPTITWPHNAMASRTAVAMYDLLAQESGFDYWTICCVASDTASYVGKAVAWARALPGARANLTILTKRFASRLWNRPHAAQEWAELILEMASKAPQHPMHTPEAILLGREGRTLRASNCITVIAFSCFGVSFASGTWKILHVRTLRTAAFFRVRRLGVRARTTFGRGMRVAELGKYLWTLKLEGRGISRPWLSQWTWAGPHQLVLQQHTPIQIPRGASPQLPHLLALDSDGLTLELAPGSLLRLHKSRGRPLAATGRSLKGLTNSWCCVLVPESLLDATARERSSLLLGAAMLKKGGGKFVFYAYQDVWPHAVVRLSATCCLASRAAVASCREDVSYVEGLAWLSGGLQGSGRILAHFSTERGHRLARSLDFAKLTLLLHAWTST